MVYTASGHIASFPNFPEAVHIYILAMVDEFNAHLVNFSPNAKHVLRWKTNIILIILFTFCIAKRVDGTDIRRDHGDYLRI